MSSIVEVRIAGLGRVCAGEAERDPKAEAICDLCGEEADAVASVSHQPDGPFACKACLRSRLEAITVASWELRQPGEGGLPWGKFSG